MKKALLIIFLSTIFAKVQTNNLKNDLTAGLIIPLSIATTKGFIVAYHKRDPGLFNRGPLKISSIIEESFFPSKNIFPNQYKSSPQEIKTFWLKRITNSLVVVVSVGTLLSPLFFHATDQKNSTLISAWA